MIRCHYCGKVLTPEEAVRRQVVTGSTNYRTQIGESLGTGSTWEMVDLCPPCASWLDKTMATIKKQGERKILIVAGIFVTIFLAVLLFILMRL